MSFLVNEYANSTSFRSEFISIFHESKFEPLLTFGLPPNVVTPAIKGGGCFQYWYRILFILFYWLSTAYNHTIDYMLLDLILADKWFDISSCKDAVDSS
jgi:hypothetical protein